MIDFRRRRNALGEQNRNTIRRSCSSPGLSDAHNGAVAERLAAAVRERHRPMTRKFRRGVRHRCGFCYDAAGVPSVVFGPGSIEQAHTADEWVPLAEVQQAADILYQVLIELAGKACTQCR